MKGKSIGEKIRRSRIIIENALANQEIKHRLKEIGFPPSNLQKGKALLEKVVLLSHQQKDKYGEKYNITDALNADFQALKDQYMIHLNIARAAFYRNRGVQTSMGINRPLPKNRTSWTEQFFRFYTKAQELDQPLAPFGLSKSEIEQALAMTAAFVQIQNEQQDKRGDAQRATQQRDQAVRALDRWVSGFKAIVKVAVEDDPQLLEKLGMVIPS